MRRAEGLTASTALTRNEYTTPFRLYDAKMGSWMTHDPILHAGVSPYEGLGSNPIMMTDPWGLEDQQAMGQPVADRSVGGEAPLNIDAGGAGSQNAGLPDGAALGSMALSTAGIPYTLMQGPANSPDIWQATVFVTASKLNKAYTANGGAWSSYHTPQWGIYAPLMPKEEHKTDDGMATTIAKVATNGLADVVDGIGGLYNVLLFYTEVGYEYGYEGWEQEWNHDLAGDEHKYTALYKATKNYIETTSPSQAFDDVVQLSQEPRAWEVAVSLTVPLDVSKLTKVGVAVEAAEAVNATKTSIGTTGYRYMTLGELDAVQQTGFLRGGRVGETYFTKDLYLSGAKAQQRLALPTSPTLRVEFEILNDPILLRIGSKVQPVYGMVGGGSEFMTTDAVQVRLINWQPIGGK